jgi:uncharacterized membrane protein YphA (DoxX/SURF4 family)
MNLRSPNLRSPNLRALNLRALDRRWLSTAARLLLGGLFLATGYLKMTDLDGFTRQVRLYELLPETLVPIVGNGLPLLELLLGLLFLLGLVTRATAVLSVPVFAAFVIGISWAWANDLKIECGCFSNNGIVANPVPGYLRELAINTVALALCAWLIRFPASRFSLDGVLGLDPSVPATSSTIPAAGRKATRDASPGQPSDGTNQTSAQRTTAQRQESKPS